MKKHTETLKKLLDQFWENFQDKLNESHLFNLLKERYESLSIARQKTIKYIIGTGLLLLILVIPVFYLTSSFSYWSEFKVKYRLSQRLLKLRTSPTAFQSARSPSAVKQTMERLIKKYRPEGWSLKHKPGKNKESSVKTEVFEIKVDHLNIKQVIQLGTDLNALPSVRLESLQIRESAQYTNHYDTTYEAHHYFMKRLIRRQSAPPKPKKTRSKKRKNPEAKAR